MAGSDTTEGQALWQPGGAEEDSRLREGNRHLHLAYDEEEEEDSGPDSPSSDPVAPDVWQGSHQVTNRELFLTVQME